MEGNVCVCVHGRWHRPRSGRHRRRPRASASSRQVRPKPIGRQPSAAAQITGAVQLPLFLLEGVAILAEVFALLIVSQVRHAARRTETTDESAGPARSRALHLDHRHLSAAAGRLLEVRLAAAAGALQARQDSIRKSLDDARQAKQELERLHAESAQILAAGARRGRHDPVAHARRTPTGSATS